MTPQQGIAIEVPHTRAQLEALGATRAELSAQLGSLSQRRAELAEQIARTSGPENRAELQTRLREVDGRIRRLESQIDAANDAITQGLARGVGQSEARAGEAAPSLLPVPPVPPLPPSEHVIHIPPLGGWSDVAVGRALMLEAVGFLLLGVVFYHWMKRRFTRAQPAPDAHAISTMQQSIDAIALEVERISENQRYVTKLLNEGGRPADPVGQQQREPVRDARNR